jgi:hypothetical protein
MQAVYSSPTLNNPYTEAMLQFPAQVLKHTPTIRKVGAFVSKIVEAASYAQGTSYLPTLVKGISYTNSTIGFYDSFKDGAYWLTPFQVQALDQKLFVGTLEASIQAWIPSKSISKVNVAKVTQEFLKKNPRSAEEARYALEYTLVENGCSWLQAVRVANGVEITLKRSTPMQSIAKAFATMWVFGNNLSTLQSWNVINLAQLSHQIGSQAPVLQFVEKIALKTILRVTGGVTMALVFLQISYKMVNIHLKIYNKTTPNPEDEKAKKQVRWDFAATTLNCVTFALPLALPLSAPVLIGLGLAANGFGFVHMFCKP